MNTPSCQSADELTLVILAAGMGSRYGGLKQLDSIGPGGECVMDYSVFDAARAGFSKAVFIIRPDMERAFHEALGERLARHIATGYAFQTLDRIPPPHAVPPGRVKPWGTAHAILMAREAATGPFAVINADDFYGRRSFEALAGALRIPADQPGDYCMVGFPLRNTLSAFGTVSRGICRVDETGFLQGIQEHTRIRAADGSGRLIDEDAAGHPGFHGNEPVSMNMWGFRPDFFDRIESAFERFLRERIHDPKAEFYIPDVIDPLIRSREARIRVLPTPEAWFGVTYSEDKPHVVEAVRHLIAQGVYPETLRG